MSKFGELIQRTWFFWTSVIIVVVITVFIWKFVNNSNHGDGYNFRPQFIGSGNRKTLGSGNKKFMKQGFSGMNKSMEHGREQMRQQNLSGSILNKNSE